MERSAARAALALCVLTASAVSAAGQVDLRPADRPSTASRREVGSTEPLRSLVLMKATDGAAVIRFANGPLEKVKVGDLVGSTKAVVKQIDAGRIVLDETFTGSDGKPNRASIIIKEGERSGTRYLQRVDGPK